VALGEEFLVAEGEGGDVLGVEGLKGEEEMVLLGRVGVLL